MKIPFSPPYIDDNVINEVVDSLKSGWITTGPKVKALEEENIKVNAKMQFYASFDKVSNFDEEYTMSTHKDVFHLDEEAE